MLNFNLHGFIGLQDTTYLPFNISVSFIVLIIFASNVVMFI